MRASVSQVVKKKTCLLFTYLRQTRELNASSYLRCFLNIFHKFFFSTKICQLSIRCSVPFFEVSALMGGNILFATSTFAKHQVFKAGKVFNGSGSDSEKNVPASLTSMPNLGKMARLQLFWFWPRMTSFRLRLRPQLRLQIQLRIRYPGCYGSVSEKMLCP